MTYLDHFSLAIPPFASTPDPSFFFPSHNYSNIVASLEFAIRRDFGIVKLVGDDGTGKTTLSRLLQDNLARDHATIAMLDARASGRILPALCECFGLQAEADPFESLKRFLLSQNHFGRLTVAIIDEAHHLEPEDFKALVRLERLDVEKKKLLQIVLLGHSQLDERLEQPDSGELARYIVFSLSTQPLNDEECRRYLLHRLRLARPVEAEAEEFPPVFSDSALEQLARWSGGVPHVLNLLAEGALQKAFGDGAKLVQSAHVLKAARAYPALVAGRPSRLALLRAGRKSFLILALILALISAVVTLVELLSHRTSIEPPPPVPVELPKLEKARPEPPKVEPTKVEPPKVEAPKIEQPKVEAPKVQAPPPPPPPPPPAPKSEPAKVVAPPPPPPAAVVPVVPPQPVAKPEVKPQQKPDPKPVKPKPVKTAPAKAAAPVSAKPVPEEAPAPSNPGQISPDDAAPPPPVATPKPEVDINDALKAGSGVYPGRGR